MSGHRIETCKDVFLSHASRDKELYVRRFAHELDRVGISYWLDQAEIKWGDRITRKINEGLRNSKYVIVFLSENFLGRNWPETELEAALSKENANGVTVVLPLIIGDTSKILNRYPLLRDKLFLEWDDDLSTVSSQLTNLLTVKGAPNTFVLPTPETVRVQAATRLPSSQRYLAEKLVIAGIIGGGLLVLVLAIGTYILFSFNYQTSQNMNVSRQANTIGQDAIVIAITDVNLRDGPAASFNAIGLVESGSRVRVIKVENNWFQVRVLERARLKVDPNSADEGWAHSRWFSLPSQ
jgi:hypothetical protein